MPRTSRYAAAAAVVVASLAAVSARAQVVASTFGPGDSYTPLTGWTVASNVGTGGLDPTDYFAIAMQFTSSLGYSAPLSFFRVASFRVSGPDAMHVDLLSGADLNTATLLESFLTVSATPIQTFVSVLQPAIVPGQTYWITLSLAPTESGWYAWNLNDQGSTGHLATRVGAGSPWGTSDTSIDATFDVNVTPEPATLALLASGLLLVGGAMRRRIQRRC